MILIYFEGDLINAFHDLVNHILWEINLRLSWLSMMVHYDIEHVSFLIPFL